MLESFATKVLNITDEELKALIYEIVDEKEVLKADANDLLINKYAEKAKQVKDNEQKKFDQGYQKRHKETATEVKGLIKEKFGIDVETEDITEMFNIASEKVNEKVKTKSTLTDDQIKTHPAYTQREKELNEAIKKMETDFASEKDSIIANYQRKENLIKVKEKAEALLVGSGAVLSDDPQRRKNQINVFLNQFEGYDYDLSSDVPLILKDGQRLEDKLNNPVKFDDFISTKAKELFDFKVQDDKGSGGNDNKGGGASGTYIFKDFADYQNQYNAEPDRSKRIEINTAWETMNKK